MWHDPRAAKLLVSLAETECPLDVLVLYRTPDGWAFRYDLEDVDDALFELRTAAIKLREIGAARRREASKPATRNRPKPRS